MNLVLIIKIVRIMAKEKIKVSVIIDKEAVKNIAFRASQAPEEYKEVEKIIDNNDEILHDNTEETDEDVKKAGNILIGKIGLNSILRANKDLLITKRLDEEDKHDEEPDNNDGDGNGANINVVKISGDKAKEILKSLLGDNDKED